MPDDDPLRDIGVKVGAYKCFGEPQGFEHILPFNIIIGRNNAGKSALLDVLGHMVLKARLEMFVLDGKTASIIVTAPFTRADLDHVESPEWGNKDRSVGRRVSWSPQADRRQPLVSLEEIMPPVPRGLLE